MKSIVKKPWGSFEVLEEGEKYTLKRINVSPNGVLSLQRHQHRSEHWIVVEGQAEVRIDDKTYNLAKIEEDDDWIDKYINKNNLFYKHFGIDKSPFKDKIVLIGSSLDEDNDFVVSPYNYYRGIETNMPGVELHANAIQQLVDSNFIQVPTSTLSLSESSYLSHIFLILLFVLFTA